jgi:glutamate-5-semialdehyde dehydrogenase
MSDDLKQMIDEMGRKARSAARVLATATTEEKNRALNGMADALDANAARIGEENEKDLRAGEENGLGTALIDRLRLTPERVASMANGIRKIVSLPDPVGANLEEWQREDGLKIRKISVPIGVIGIIYESRPNVTSDAAVLCLKAGNATILRGGREAIHSNRAIAEVLREGIRNAGLPADCVQLVPNTDRAGVGYMAQMNEFIDCIIPRGGKGLIERVVSEARMPVIKHYDGICHGYVDKDADPRMASEVIINGKCQRPSVCNALETLLVHQDVAEQFLQNAGRDLLAAGVELRCDERGLKILRDAGSADSEKVKPATNEDWTTEYLDLILSVRVVDSIDEAIDHIEVYGSHHSDVIVTDNVETAEKFLNGIDSSAVFWNSSTRFNDGEEFGFGAEIGISTDKLHARGPMGLRELTSYKYQVRGSGQIKA